MVSELKQVTDRQLDQLMALWLASNFQGHPFILETYWLENQALVREMLPQSRLFIQEKNGEIIGFLGLMDTLIAGIFVKEECQKQGIGKALLEKVKIEVEELSLHVYKKNSSAQKFYLGQGFQVVAEDFDEDTKEIEYRMVWKKSKYH